MAAFNIPNGNTKNQPSSFVFFILRGTSFQVRHHALFFAEDDEETYKDLERTCTVIVWLIKPFV